MRAQTFMHVRLAGSHEPQRAARLPASWTRTAFAVVAATTWFAAPASALECPGLEATLSGAPECRGGSFKVRAVAAVALGAKGDAASTDALAAALNSDPHYAVRAAAASGLGRLQDLRGVGPLLRALDDDTVFVREQAERALERFHRPDALLAFRDALASSSVNKRKAAVAAYATTLKDGYDGATTAVVNALGDDDESIRQLASDSLEAVPLVKALSSLLDALENGEESVRAASAQALARRPDPMAADALIDARQRLGESARVRIALRGALAAHKEWLDVDSLKTKAANEDDEAERLRALDVLAAIEDPAAVDLLIAALTSPKGHTRSTSGRLLQELGGAKAKSALDAAVSREKDPRVKRQLELSARRTR